jgi:hypothetical protein
MFNKEIIGELRSRLDAHNPRANFRKAPDWVIVNLYERYRGLPVSNPVGKPRTRSLAEINRRYETRTAVPHSATRTVVPNVTEVEERERMARQLALANL